MEDKYFVITRLHRDDISSRFADIWDLPEEKVTERLKRITDEEMKRLASRMESDYLDQLYWGSLEILAKDLVEKYTKCGTCGEVKLELQKDPEDDKYLICLGCLKELQEQ